MSTDEKPAGPKGRSQWNIGDSATHRGRPVTIIGLAKEDRPGGRVDLCLCIRDDQDAKRWLLSAAGWVEAKQLTKA